MKQLFDSVFSWKLYREALSQLRLMGFLTSGALLIFMAVLPILDATAWSWHGRNFARDASMIDFSVLLYLYVWIAPFILTFALFGFLNSRKKSDFYHSLPVTRQALFLSFVKAVLTWLLVTVVLAVLIPATIYALLGAPRVFSEVGPLLLLLIPALSFAVAVAALVASVSGTRFTNLSLAVVIIAIPPLLSEFLRNAVADSVPTLAPSGVGLFGLQLSNTYYTFDMWSILDTIGREGGRWLQEMLLNAGFTAVVALVLLLCAGIFFVRRRSEMAGNSAPNQWMQWMYRISIAFLPLLVFFMQDFMFFHIADFISGLMVTLIISIILVCAFDLISTKAWKNLLYAIPAVGIASLIMILLVTLIWGVALSESTFSPKPEQIQSVRVVNARNPAWGWDFITHGNTTEMQALQRLRDDRVRITDPEVNNQVVELLDDMRIQPTWGNLGRLNNSWDQWSGTDNTIDAQIEVILTSGQRKNLMLPVAAERWGSGAMNPTISLNDLGEALVRVDSNR